MRIVVMGARGQLGQDLVRVLPGEVIPTSREQADLSDSSALRAYLEALCPDVVVNCAAYNFVDRAESEPDVAFAVNAWAVRNLAKLSGELRYCFVHVSTDYVFGLDAARRSPYEEGDAPGPVGVYGLSKLAGEYLTRAFAPEHLVVRTCGLYGLHGQGGKKTNFLETMLRLAGEGKPLRVVFDQICTPSYTVDVAQGIASLIQAKARGLFHVTNAGSCSWYELAKELFARADMNVNLSPIPSAEYPTAAKRPAYSVLSTSRAEAAGVQRRRPWQEAVGAYLDERRSVRR